MSGLPTVLFRKSRETEHEEEICREFFPTINIRAQIPWGNTIIGRYSVLPYYRELEADAKEFRASLINSWEQHRYIANFEYYYDVSRWTPRTWFDGEMQHCDCAGPFIVKGRTNSKKWKWDTKMFAEDKKAALLLGAELSADELIGPQGIIYREYLPLKRYETGINGLPFTNEWRCFFYKEKLLSYGYYWGCAEDASAAYFPSEAIDLAQEIAKVIARKTNFFVLDLAQRETGEWILIEVNDGQMAGLSLNDPRVLYRNLKIELQAHPLTSQSPIDIMKEIEGAVAPPPKHKDMEEDD